MPKSRRSAVSLRVLESIELMNVLTSFLTSERNSGRPVPTRLAVETHILRIIRGITQEELDEAFISLYDTGVNLGLFDAR